MTAPTTLHAPVLIVGGGPVGLTLAIDLGRRGVECILVERNTVASVLPKMELCNARSMEIFARLGLAQKIRRAGWPADTPMDVWVGPSLSQAPYAVLRYPSVAAQQASIAASTDHTGPREAYQRISQYSLEPLLRAEAEATPGVTVLFGHSLESFDDVGTHVEAVIRQADGTALNIHAKYLAGCDGGNSTVRRALGIEFEGRHAVARHLMIFFRAPDLLARTGAPLARHYYIAGERHATLVAQDDLKRWALHVQIAPDCDASKLSPHDELRAALGIDLAVELIHVGAWSAHLVVAEQYGRGRVFLAGDAAHQYIPTGGFGMNTGIGDADNLGWKLAATLRGWGGRALLASYAIERLPIGRRNRDAAGYAAEGGRAWRELFTPQVLEDSPQGVSRRAAMVAAIETGQRRSHEMHGIELGYRYLESPICLHDAGPGPDSNAPNYTPTTMPGARLPHFWLDDNVSVHDHIGQAMTLLCAGGNGSIGSRFADVASALGIPLRVLRLEPSARRFCEAEALLVRPDLHIAWRGSAADDAVSVLRTAAGHGAQVDDSQIKHAATGQARQQRSALHIHERGNS